MLLVAILAGAVLFFTQLVPTSDPAGRRTKCLANLKVIGEGLKSYLEGNDNRWPYITKMASLEKRTPPWPNLPTLLAPQLGSDTSVFRCPNDRRELPADHPLAAKHGRKTTYFETEGTSYEWLFGESYGGRKVGDDPISNSRGLGLGLADQPLAIDFGPFHEGDGKSPFNTLYADLRARPGRTQRDGR